MCEVKSAQVQLAVADEWLCRSGSGGGGGRGHPESTWSVAA